MTKEEILAMGAGVELDALVLREIFGCNVEIKAKYCYCLCEDMDKQLEHRDCEHHYGAAISPSTDISAAWPVVEKLKQDWDSIELIWDVGAWDICLENYDTHRIFFLGEEAGETYEKLPEAICKAALLAKLKV